MAPAVASVMVIEGKAEVNVPPLGVMAGVAAGCIGGGTSVDPPPPLPQPIPEATSRTRSDEERTS